MKKIRRYIFRVLIAFDRFANALFGGEDHETISHRAYDAQGTWWADTLLKFLEWIDPGHGESAERSDTDYSDL